MVKFFLSKNEFLSLFLIKINKIYSYKEKISQKSQNTSDNFEKYQKPKYQKSTKMAKTLQIQSKATIKIHFRRKKILTKKSIFWPIVKISNSPNFIFYFILATLGQKYVKFESKLHKNTLIYSEILRKLPL